MQGVLEKQRTDWTRALGPERADELIEKLSSAWRARATAAAVMLDPASADELVVRGEMSGRIVHGVRGDGGFGYDVVFEADDRPGVTTGELSVPDKDAISHRGKALRQLAPLVAPRL